MFGESTYPAGMRIFDGDWDGGGVFVREGKRRGRGAVTNASGRFEAEQRCAFDDGWDLPEEEDEAPLKTQVFTEYPRRIITTNASPDIPFEQSINPYRGCEHGCIYCFARPTHAFHGLSPGLDFETRIFAKPDAARLLARELRDPKYKPRTIAMGTNTDPYQPAEKEQRVMRQILEVLEAFSHPVTVLTKSSLILRDVDILSRMAKRNLAAVALSVTSLDHRLSRKMEPRAASPKRRLMTLKALAEAGLRPGVMVAPVIPAINDHEIERILEAIHAHGARRAAFIFLRLPHEIKDLFHEWLEENFPDRKNRVLNHIRAMKGGRYNRPGFHARFKNDGAYADAIKKRFASACKKLDLNKEKVSLTRALFKPPPFKGEQFDLFKSS